MTGRRVGGRTGIEIGKESRAGVGAEAEAEIGLKRRSGEGKRGGKWEVIEAKEEETRRIGGNGRRSGIRSELIHSIGQRKTLSLSYSTFLTDCQVALSVPFGSA